MKIIHDLEVDPLSILEYYNVGILRYDDEQIMALCPFHTDTAPSFSMNREKGIWYCFGCGKKGNIYRFIELIEGVQNYRARVILYNLVKDGNCYATNKIKKKKKKKAIEINEKFLKNFEHKHSWFYFEGFTNKTLQEWQLGYCKEKNAITVPVRDINNKLISVIYRKLDGLPKYLYMPNFTKSAILFGENRLKGKKGIIVEGSLDVIWLWQWGIKDSVSILGNLISKKQIELIKKYFQEIIICLDNDRGGKLGTDRILYYLKNKISIYLTDLPENRKDIRNCTLDEIQKILKNKRRE